MKKFVLIIGAVLVLVVVAGVFIVWRYPLAVFNWSNRRALAKAGFVESQIQSPAGAQNVFVGGNGPVLLMLHGAGDQAGAWSKVAPALTSKYQVVVLDLAGHGKSAPQTGPISIGAVLDGVSAIIEAKSPSEPVTIVGNSLGAWVAMVYAHRHPGRVIRIVAVDGGPITGDRVNYAHLPVDREDARKMFEAVIDPGSPRPANFFLDDLVRQSQNGALGRVVQAGKEDMSKYLLDGKLGEVQTPVDLLWGESDQLVPLEYARKLEAQLPAVRLSTLPRCGHVPQQECPKAFEKALTNLLAQPTPAPKSIAPAAAEVAIAGKEKKL